MISVLIPIHNYDVTELVKEIHEQLERCNLIFEIVCFEDGSNNEFVKQNQTIKRLSNTEHIVSNLNIGRVEARQSLSNKSKYDWLLFLDADVQPKNSSFITSYTNLIDSSKEAIFGGFAYKKEKPNKNNILRWVYGKKKEEVSSLIRNKNPYKIIISANFLIKKTVFNFINSHITGNSYGFDNYFGALLKSNKVRVLHIDNEVYHLGMEANINYLKKKEEAAKTLIYLHKLGKMSKHNNDLLNLFIKLKKYKMNYLFAVSYKLFQKLLRKNILSANPSIKLFQFYRISFMCHTDLNIKLNA